MNTLGFLTNKAIWFLLILVCFYKKIMTRIGLLREGKIPEDNRVALTPAQCKWLQTNYPSVEIVAQRSSSRCFSDMEYERAGISVSTDLGDCNILL